jgi:hypothetical protein
MKVKDLIKKLSKLDPNLEVMIECDTSGNHDDWGVYYNKYSGPKVIEAWKRSDMTNTYGPYKNEEKPKKLLIIL